MHTIKSTAPRLRSTVDHVVAPPFSTDYFSMLKSASSGFEAQAWRRFAKWYDRVERDFLESVLDNGLPVVTVVKEVCQSHGCPDALDEVLMCLYLTHRIRFLTEPQDYYLGEDGYSAYPPSGTDADHEMVDGYGYPGVPGEIRDVIDLDLIDLDNVGEASAYPFERLWGALKLDCELPLGVIKYDEIEREVKGALCCRLAERKAWMASDVALGHLSKCLLDMKVVREGVMPAMALAAHALLLQSC